MDMLRIHRLNARYHLPPSRLQERERLDQILRQVLAEALEIALERCGVSPHEEVCIRRLSVPVRLRLSLADSSLVLAWSLALGEAIMRARRGEQVPDVVLYNSIAHALFDMTQGVAADRFERAWAWRLAGVWHGSESPSASAAAGEWVSVLLSRPDRIVPLLTALAANTTPTAVFATLLRRVSVRQWWTLAHAALHVAGIVPALFEAAALPGVAEIDRQARRMLAASALAHAFAAAPPELLDIQEMRQAFAALIVLEQDPAVLRAAPRARVLVGALSAALHSAGFSTPSEGIGLVQGSRNTLAAMTSDDLPAVVTRRARTRFGGLPFLLNVIEALGLPEDMLASCAGRSFRWLLHQVALALVPAEPDDPALLAFVGLLPDAVPPSRDEAAITASEHEVIAAFAERIRTGLDELFDEKQPLAFVCQREAEIVADPGWIEVRFGLDQVSTTIRRVGLDLDPGYVPWLGVVLRFVYV